MKKSVSLIFISILILSSLSVYVFAQEAGPGNICCDFGGYRKEWVKSAADCAGGKVACVRGYPMVKKDLTWYDYGVCGDGSTTGPTGQGGSSTNPCGFVLQTENYKWGGWFSGGSPPVGIPAMNDPSWPSKIPDEGLTTAMSSCISPSGREYFKATLNAVVSNPRDTASASKAIEMLQTEIENRQSVIYELVARGVGIEAMNTLPDNKVKDILNEFYNARITGQEVNKLGFRSVGACEIPPTNRYSACWPGFGGQYASEIPQGAMTTLTDQYGNPVDLSAEIAKAEAQYASQTVTPTRLVAPLAPRVDTYYPPVAPVAPQPRYQPRVPTAPSNVPIAPQQQRRTLVRFYLPFFGNVVLQVD